MTDGYAFIAVGAGVLDAPDAATVLERVRAVKCGAADVYADGAYVFTMMRDPDGLWLVFQRGDHEPEFVSFG